MYSVICDANVLRSWNHERFTQILAGEHARGIVQLTDPWTLFELIARLRDPRSRDYWPCRRALHRAWLRSLQTEPPGLIFPAEAQIVGLLFGRELPDVIDTLNVLLEVCRIIATAGDADTLEEIQPAIVSIAEQVTERESWFGSHLAELTHLVRNHGGVGDDARGLTRAREFLRSNEFTMVDAPALVKRAYSQAGLEVPSPLPEDQVAMIARVCAIGSMATATAIERVVCDGANTDSDRIRNLLWDQEVAFQVGQQVGGFSTLLVTDDRLFKEAAARAGGGGAVLSAAEYSTRLV